MNTKISILVFSSLFICAAHAAQASAHDLSQDPDLLPDQAVQLDQPHLEHQPGFFTLIKDHVKSAWSNAKPETQEKINKYAAYGTKILATYGFISLGIDVTDKALSIFEANTSKVAVGVGLGFLGHGLWSAVERIRAQKKQLETQRLEQKVQTLQEMEQRANEHGEALKFLGESKGLRFQSVPATERFAFTKEEKAALLDEPKKPSCSANLVQTYLDTGFLGGIAKCGLAAYATLKLVPQVATLIKDNPKTAALGLGAAAIAHAFHPKKS